MLADQAGDWGAARQYLRRAARLDPGLLCTPHFLRRLAKVHAGRRVYLWARAAARGAGEA